MPRKGHIAKRDVLPDPIYNSKLVTRAINAVMLDGKKELLKAFYTVLSIEFNH
jgi:small subunit ribosomal protein S7